MNKTYLEYKDLVFNLALNYLQNKEDAEEITQDVFISVYQKLDSFKEDSSLKTWIYRITINKSLDFIKAKNREKRSFFLRSVKLDNPDNNVVHPDFNHPGVLMENKEELARIFSGINSLKDRQKTVIILLKIEQKTQVETAEIMGITTKAIESLFQRAKKNLSIILKLNEGS